MVRTIKYVGSKARIAKDIVPIIQKCIDDNGIKNYYEPFVGGANMIEHLHTKMVYINPTECWFYRVD